MVRRLCLIVYAVGALLVMSVRVLALTPEFPLGGVHPVVQEAQMPLPEPTRKEGRGPRRDTTNPETRDGASPLIAAMLIVFSGMAFYLWVDSHGQDR